MSKQALVVRSAYRGRKLAAALVLAVALSSLPLLAANVPGPLSSFFVQPAYACPVGGSCG